MSTVPRVLQATSFPEQVLVVDDEPVITEILVRFLRDGGLDATGLTSAQAALALAGERGFGCLMTDKNMPGLDGLELIRRVRQMQPWCGCILVTGYASVQSAIEALQLGASDYLEKPLPELDLVVEKVRLVLKNQRLHFERDMLLSRLRAFEAELGRTPSVLEGADGEVRLFDALLERRVAEATRDLRDRARALAHQLAGSKGLDFAVRISVDTLLDAVRRLQPGEDVNAAELRAGIARVTRLLEEHRALLEVRPELRKD